MKYSQPDFQEATARQRISALVDKDSFREFCPPQERKMSMHLPHFDIPRAFDDGIIVGEALIEGKTVAIAAQEGRFMGGAIGEVHSAKLIGIMKRAVKYKVSAFVMLLDSGGVRLQEANAGEIGVSEIIRALLDLRSAGIKSVALIGGVCGCFGGAGLICGCCDTLIVSEGARIGVSGPEVIETTMGVEAFDSRDRALVWRTCGGKNRFLFSGARLVNSSIEDFRRELLRCLSEKALYSRESVENKLKILEQRIKAFGDCKDAFGVWEKMNIKDPENIPSLSVDEMMETLRDNES